MNFFRLFTLILVIYFGSVTANAQTSNPYRDLVSSAPYFTLYEQGRFMNISSSSVDIAHHNGVVDSLNTQEDYIWEHVNLYRSCDSSVAPSYPTAESLSFQYKYELWGLDPDTLTPTEAIAFAPSYDAIISVTDWDYSRINMAALDSGYIYFDSTDSTFKLRTESYYQQDTLVTDTAVFFSGFPRDTSSYELHTMFIEIDSAFVHDFSFIEDLYFALGMNTHLVTIDPGKTAKFYLPSELYFTNSSNSELYLDFGNGLPPVSVVADSVYEVAFPSDGLYQVKLIENPICNPLEENCIVSTFEIDVRSVSGPSFQFAVDPQSIENYCGLNYLKPLPEEIIYPGNARFPEFFMGEAVVSVWLRKVNPDPNGRITRPVIVLDGFNSYDAIDPINDATKYSTSSGILYGKINAASIASGRFPSKEGVKESPALSRFPDFIDSVTANDYDFVFVDWRTNRHDIQANANCFKEILQQVNHQMSLAESAEQVVVIGASMGGQIARVGLREMEIENCCHNTRLYVSFDSPHHGAHIPLSLQHLIYSLYTYFAPIGIVAGPLVEAKHQYEWVLASPAARQMLIQHRDGNDPHDDYYSYLDQIGYPQIPERIAITNGSYTGMPQGSRVRNSTNNEIVGLQLDTLFEGSRYLELNANVALPRTIPSNVFKLYDLLRFNLHEDHEFVIMHANAYVTTDDPSGGLQQTLLERGAVGNVNYLGALTHYFTALLYNTTFYTNIVWHDAALLINSACPPCMATVAGSKIGTSVYLSSQGSLILIANGLANSAANSGTAGDITVGAIRGYDHVPGSFITTPMDIGMDDAIFDVVNSKHTFMATTSTIGLDTSNVNIDISSITSPVVLNQVPFSAVYFNRSKLGDEQAYISHNQEHVEMTTTALGWLMNQITNSNRIPDIHLNSQDIWELSSKYNFGQSKFSTQGLTNSNLSLQYIPSVNILNQGVLTVNKAGAELGFGGTEVSRPAHYEITASSKGCTNNASHVQILQGGFMVVGDSTSNYQSADVYFPADSKLEVAGTLVLNNNSTLELQEGSALIIHPGARIVLNGPEAKMVIRGDIQLSTSAILTTEGDGLLEFAIPGLTYGTTNSHIQLDGNNRFEIMGADTSSFKLLISETLFLTTAWDSVYLDSCLIQISDGEYFDVRPKYHVNRVHIDSYDPMNTGGIEHSGFRVYGFNPGLIENSRFSHGRFGLFINGLVGSYNQIMVENCRFNENIEGASTRGGGMYFTDCVFASNDIGLWYKDQASTATIDHCLFIGNDIGALANSMSTQHLDVQFSSFNSNDVGLRANDIYADLQCSEWNVNTIAIESNFSKIDVSNSALNDFNNNDLIWSLYNSEELYLVDGYNNFSGNTHHIDGTFYFGGGVGNLTGPSSGVYYLDMENNYPSGSMYTTMLAEISGLYSVLLQNTAYSQLYASCSIAKGPDVGSGKQGYVSTHKSVLLSLVGHSNYNVQQISTPHFTGVPFGLGVQTLLSTDSINEVEVSQAILTALSQLSLLGARDSALYFTVLQTCGNVLTKYTDSAAVHSLGTICSLMNNVSIHFSARYRAAAYHWLAMRARNDVNYPQAISLNQQAVNVANSDQLERMNYWTCVMDAENLLLTGVIDNDEYLRFTDSCTMLFNQFKQSHHNYERANNQDAQKLGATIHPNPSSDCSVIEFNELDIHYIQLLGLHGQVIAQYEINAEESYYYLCPEDLATGSYFINLYDSQLQLVQTLRWIIRKQ